MTIMNKHFLLFVFIPILNFMFENTAVSREDDRQNKLVGYVYDEYGPVVGAAVFIDKTTNGDSSGLDGEFTLTGLNNKDKIIISMIGYETQELRYSGQDTVRIVLNEVTSMLEGVVVTALGIERDKMALSYNLQQVDSDLLTTVKDANFVNSLAGKVAGVQISSGAAGSGSATRVVMRGMKSIEKSNAALYVIDGIPMYNSGSKGSSGAFGGSMGTEAAADINPEDIESVSMLTGASAAALYGSAAANGVVLINTRKGKAGRARVTFSHSTSVSDVYMMPELQSRYGGSTMNNWDGGKVTGNYNPEDFFRSGLDIINSITLSAGTDKNQTYASASSTNSSGILPNTKYDRYNFTVRNTTYFGKDRFVLDIGASYILQYDRNMVAQGRYNNPLPALYMFPSGEDYELMKSYEYYDEALGYCTQYWPYGSGDYDAQNPYWIMNNMLRETSRQRYMLNASLKWNITGWMNITARGKVDNTDWDTVSEYKAGTLTTFSGEYGQYSSQMQKDKTFYGDIILNINKKWDDWSLNINAGGSINDIRSQAISASGRLKYPNYFAFNNLNLEQGFSLGQSAWHEQTQSVFAAVEAGWKDAVYLTVTGRNDWASQLAFSNQSSFFYPSVGLSAVISNLVDLPSWFNILKVRASYSEVSSPFSRYLSNPAYTYNSSSQTWSKPTTYPAYDLRPENTKSWEAGFNMYFLDCLSLDVTYYHTNTYNQTIYAPLSSSTGYSNFIAQTGNIQNQGMEVALNFNRNWNGFSWDSGLTYSFNKNLIKELAHGIPDPITGNTVDIVEIQKTTLGYDNVAPKIILREGGSMLDIYDNHKLVQNDDGSLGMVQTDWEYMGSLAPDGNLGWNNSFSYKGVSLGFVINTRLGGKVYSATQGMLDYYGASEASAAARDNGGVVYNGVTYDPRTYYQTVAASLGGYGRYYLYDATNVRLQELSLQYTFPKKWFRYKAGVTLGLVARNLWMIYCKAPFDPEMTGAAAAEYYQGVDYFMLPSTRSIGVNLKISF